MKKVLSLVLTLAILVGTLFSVPLSAKALTGSEIATGTWWCSVVNCFNYSQSDVYFTGSGYGYYPQGENSITINADVTPWAIYTRLDGLEENTQYTLSFNYDVAGGIDASNSGVILNNGIVPVWQDNRIHKTQNTVYGLGVDDTENKKITIDFTTDSNTDYFLSVKAIAGLGAVTLSNFEISTAALPEEETEGRKIANGYWRNGASLDVNSKDDNGNLILQRGTNSLTITEGYYGNWVIYTCLELKPKHNYEISFNYTHLEPNDCFILLDNNASVGPTFYNANDPQYINPNANTVLARATTEGNRATFKFATDSNTKYYLAIKGTYSPGETEVFSNFSVKATEIPKEELTGEKIAAGTWYCSNVDFTSPSGAYWSGSGYDCYPQGENSITINQSYGLAPYAIYTKLNGLEKNTIYTLNFNYSVAGGLDASNTGVILNKNNTYSAIKWQDNRICKVNNAVYGLAIDDTANKKATITFVTDENENYFLSIKANAISENITFSNFVLQNGGVFDYEKTSNDIATGNWEVKNTGSLSKNTEDGTVTVNAPWHFAVTKLPKLPFNTLVKITLDYTRLGNNISEICIIDASEGFTVDGNGNYSVSKSNLADYYIENGKITAVFATLNDATDYYFGIKQADTLNSGVTYSNFKISFLENVSIAEAEKNGNALSESPWEIQYTGNGSVVTDKINHTITQNGYGYQDIRTKITGLKTNTKYILNGNFTAEDDLSDICIYSADSTDWKTQNMAVWSEDAENGTFTAEFVTNSVNTEYYLQFHHGEIANSNVIYSNLTLKQKSIAFEDELNGNKVADGVWFAKSGNTAIIKNNYERHSLAQSGSSNQTIYTKIDFLEPSAIYTLTANYTAGDEVNGVWVVPADGELDFNNISDYVITAEVNANGVLRFNFPTSAQKKSYYLVLSHGTLTDSEIIYTDFSLSVNEIWDNEKRGELFALGDWFVKGNSGTVTANPDDHTVTSNAGGKIIYTRINGILPGMSYRINCNYTDTDSQIEAVYVAAGEEFPLYGYSFIDNSKNLATYSLKNNYLTATFTAKSAYSNYWFAIKLKSLSDGSITFNNFSLSLPGATTINDEFSQWSSVNVTDFTATANSVTATSASGAVYTKISALDTNTAYEVDFDYDNISAINKVMIFPADEEIGSSSYWSNGYYNGKHKGLDYSSEVYNYNNKKASVVFSTNAINTEYYLVIELKLNVSLNAENIKLQKFEDLGFLGTAIRGKDPTLKQRQAMRFKNTISANVLNNGFNGLTVKEYGSIAAKSSELNSLPLVMNDAMQVSDASVKKGVAYNDTTNKIFETLDDGTKVFTAALINIANDNYSFDYTVRPYMIVTDGTNDFVVYGRPQDYSIFTVFSLIEKYGEQKDRLTVYDILDSKTDVNSAYLTFKKLDVNNKTSLNVYNNTVVSDNYKGLSGTVYHTFGYISDDTTGRQYTDEQRLIELNRLEQSGVKYCRTQFSSSWVWNGSTNKFNYSSSRMNDYINYCKALQSKGISVAMQTSWYFNSIIENTAAAGAEYYLNGNGNDIYLEQMAYNSMIANEYKLTGSAKMSTGETVTDYYKRLGVAAIRYGVYLSNVIKTAQNAGVNNMDYLIYFTEPSYETASKPEGNFANEYLFVSKTIKNVIEKIGIADVKHVGPNQGSVETGLGLLKYVVDREPDLFDVLTAHFYPDSGDIKGDTYWSSCYKTFNSYLQVLKDAGVQNKEFWVDEFFATVTNGNVKEQAESALQTIVGAICAQQLGIENIILWQIFDQAWVDTLENSNEFINGIHMTGTCPSLYVSGVPYASYYPISTFMRFNSATNGKAFATSSINSSSAQGIYIGAMQTDDGNLVITVVNVGNTEKLFSVDLETAIGKDLYRYGVIGDSILPTANATPTEYGRILRNVGSSFTDTISPYSVSVYTTTLN